MSAGELLINGAFHSSLWTRLDDSGAGEISCPVHAQTFAADRWHVRYAAPAVAPVTQARSEHVPSSSPALHSLELRGQGGVSEPVFLAQNNEPAEAHAYRRELRVTAWCYAQHPTVTGCPVRLHVGSPHTTDLFDERVELVWRSDARSVPCQTWRQLEFFFDASSFRRTGLRISLEIEAGLNDPAAHLRFAELSLHPANTAPPPPRPIALETLLARRFFQRHTARSVNAIGRALVRNPHELHFQFTFPEMRAFPALTLPQNENLLTVFSAEGVPQSGFVYDVPYAACGSAIIRATKLEHQLHDGYLAFRGYEGAILLDAEL
jgi:hypothetical protein